MCLETRLPWWWMLEMPLGDLGVGAVGGGRRISTGDILDNSKLLI